MSTLKPYEDAGRAEIPENGKDRMKKAKDRILDLICYRDHRIFHSFHPKIVKLINKELNLANEL